MAHDVLTFARELAVELTDLDPGLPAKIEAEIATEEHDAEKHRFDPLATGAAVVGAVIAAAQFAYQIHRDRKKDQQRAPEVLKRRLRLALDERHYPDTTQRARVIEAAVRIIERER